MLVMARWMQEAGHHVDVVIPTGTPAWQQALDWGLPINPAPSLPAFAKRRHAKQWAKGKQADVVWIRDRRDLAWSGHVAHALGASLVMQQAMQIPRSKKAPWHWVRYRRVDAWVTGLEWLKTECIVRTSMDEERCHVLPLPLDERWFTTAAHEKSDARQSLGLHLSEDIFLMGTVGRLDEGKGQRHALHALAKLPIHIHWLFVGNNTLNNSADERSVLLTLARELGVQSRAHFMSGQADVLPVYDALDGFALTSKSETIGTVTLEAMARRVPIIGTDAGGTSEILADNRGVLFAPGDATALANAVLQMSTAPAEKLAVGTNAAFSYVQSCRSNRLVPAWNELIDTLVESRRKA